MVYCMHKREFRMSPGWDWVSWDSGKREESLFVALYGEVFERSY